MGFWPFKKKPKVEYVDPATIRYSQADITEEIDQHLHMAADEWVETLPINEMIGHDKDGNLPPLDALPDQIYAVASQLSEMRETMRIPDDGVYCPVCHIACINADLLRQPCPKCERPLLAFGWS